MEDAIVSSPQPTRFVTREDLSKGCVEYAVSRLRARGIEPSQDAIAEELGVTQSMISQVKSGKSPSKSLSHDTIAKYATKVGLTFGQFCTQLLSLVAATRPPPSSTCPRGFSPQDLLARVLTEVEILSRAVILPKPNRNCAADKFYRKILARSYATLAQFDSRHLATSLCIRNSDESTFLISHHESSTKANRWCGTPPVDIDAAIAECVGRTGGDRLVTKSTVIQPPASVQGHSGDFWDHLVHDPRPPLGEEVLLLSVPISTSVSPETSTAMSHSTVMLFFFRQDFVVCETIQRVLWLLATVTQLVYRIELQAHVQGLQKLCGLRLQPADMRPHAAFYGEEGQRCRGGFGQIESATHRYLERIVEDPAIKDSAVAAEVWTYDWTEGRFTCLSPLFRFLNPRLSKMKIRLLDGRMRTLEEVYKEKRSRFVPRSYGRTSLIMTSQQSMMFTCRRDEHSERGVNPCFPFNGSVIGIPIRIRDAFNKRWIHGVLYLRCERALSEKKRNLVIERILALASESSLHSWKIRLGADGKDLKADGPPTDSGASSGDDLLSEDMLLTCPAAF